MSNLRIFPDINLSNISESSHLNFDSLGEKKVYQNLYNQLSEGFVKWSCSYIGTNENDETIDGECDFVIALPNQGILFLEVKGGNIEYDSIKDQWFSTDRHGDQHKIRDPYKQALKAKFQIFDKLKKHSKWPSQKINIQHSVIFPDIENPNTNLGPDRNIITLFKNDLSQIHTSILEIFKKTAGQNNDLYNIGPPILKILEEVLVPNLKIKKLLRSSLEEQETEMLSLSNQQSKLLRTLRGFKKAAIHGGAGTGKTILAMEKAKELAQSGKKTLLICMSRTLANFLYRSLKKQDLDDAQFQITNAHSLTSKLARKKNISIDKEIKNNNDLLNKHYPEILYQISETLGDEKYDAIIVDEGQDFNDDWWLAFDSIKKTDGYLYVFYDNNQIIFDQKNTFLTSGIDGRFSLFENFRNTREIFDVMQKFYHGIEIESIGPKGMDVKFIEAADIEKQDTEVVHLIDKLIKGEGIFPNEIGVLNLTSNIRSGLSNKISSISKKLNPLSGSDREVWWDYNAVLVDTVKRFKGLEKNIIILNRLSSLLDPDITSEHKIRELYVALSRAKYLLFIVGSKNELIELKKLIN